MKKNSQGFTIVELLIAASVFSSVLLIMTFGLIAIAKAYYKGSTTARTQEVAREIMNDLSQSIQLSGGQVYGPTASGTDNVICAGGKRYSYNFRQLRSSSTVTNPGDQTRNAMRVDNVTLCSSSTSAQPMSSPGTLLGRELVGQNMRVADIRLERLTSGASLYSLQVRVIYGDLDLIEDSNGDGRLDQCRSGVRGSEFCAVSELSTIIDKRVQ